MSKHFHFARPCLAAVAVLLLGTCWGCGTDLLGTKEYEKRLTETTKSLKEKSEFKKDMYPPRPVPGAPVAFQMPKSFPENPLPEGEVAEEGAQPIDPYRLKPPIESLLLTGRKLTYEGFYTYRDNAGKEIGKIAYYCYFVARPKSKSTARTPLKVIESQLKRQWPKSKFRGVIYRTNTVPCDTPTGGSTTWSRLEVASPDEQDFYFIDAEKKPSSAKMKATLQFYSHTVAGYTVIIAWRVPTDVKDQEEVDLEKWGPLVAGSVIARTPAGETPD